MKKLMMLMVSGVSVIVLSGCGGGDSDYVEPINDGLTTLFLVDEAGYAYGGIPYTCGTMTTWNQTASNGEFSFYPGEDCDFDFTGYDGNYFNDPAVDDIIRIVDYNYDGKGGIPYECASFGVGTTYGDGSFDYDIDDACTFYL